MAKAQTITPEMATNISDTKKSYRARNEGDFPKDMGILLEKEYDLKYGENPAQHGAMYIINKISGESVRTIADLTNITSVRSDGKGKGGLSLTNMMDVSRAMDNLKFFYDKLDDIIPAVAIMKHNIVSGFAKQTNPDQTTADIFRLARDADLRSNFGGTAVFNKSLNKETAEALYELKGKSPFFVDVLAAPGYEEGVVGYLESQSGNLRIGEFSHLEALPKFQGDDSQGLVSIKEMPGGRIGVQDIYLTSIKGPDDFTTHPLVYDKENNPHIVQKAPSEQELDDLCTAWWLNIAGARSNGVVFVKDGKLVAMGSGQVERVGAVAQAITKGMQKAMDREGIEHDELMGIIGYKNLNENPFKGASASSDAFFPFNDSIKLMNSVGVTAVAQPYGSIRDDVVIDALNKYKMAGPATLERCFGHF